MEQTTDKFEGWAILELMGHRRLAGYVREQEIAGAGMLRIDVPGEVGDGIGPLSTIATQFYSPAALYCLTPTTEEVARAVAKRSQPEPVHRWELPPARVPSGLEDVPSGLEDDDYELPGASAGMEER
jgi:hypothetical protein